MLLNVQGRFLGYFESDDSYESKKGPNAGQIVQRVKRELSVMTAKGPGTIVLSEPAFLGLGGIIGSLVPYVSEVTCAVEGAVETEFVNFERVPRIRYDLLDIAVHETPPPVPVGNGRTAKADATS